MGKLERTSSPKLSENCLLTRPVPCHLEAVLTNLVGHLFVHALRCASPQTWDTHLEGQIAEHGQMGQRASGCKKTCLKGSETILTVAEHEAHWQRSIEQNLQSAQLEGPDTDRRRRSGRSYGTLHTAKVRTACIHGCFTARHATQHGQHKL